MIAGFVWREAEDDSDRKLLDDVHQFRWHVVGVHSDQTCPVYSFSVGLYFTLQHPEVVVMGLPHKVAQETINHVGLLIKSGSRFVADQRYDNILDGFDVVFRPVSLKRYRDYLGYGIWFYRSLPQPFPALQLVWPDKAGLFPWECGCDQRFQAMQHKLWADA